MANPDVYIATGMAGPTGKRLSSLQLGPMVDSHQARSSFQQLITEHPILSHLNAVQQHRAYSI